jgi:hypothetical protein
MTDYRLHGVRSSCRVTRGDVFPDVRCRLAIKSFVLALPP